MTQHKPRRAAPTMIAGAAAEAVVLQALTRAANRNEPCPTNKRLAELLGASSSGAPNSTLQRLEKCGLIKVERYSASRQVTIVATGRRTRAPASAAKHWRDRPEHAAKLATINNLGPKMAELIREAAEQQGVSIVDFVVSAGASPTTAGNLSRAKAPRPLTIARFLPLLGDKLRAITPEDLLKVAEAIVVPPPESLPAPAPEQPVAVEPVPAEDPAFRPMVRTIAAPLPNAMIPPRPKGRQRTFEEQLAAVAAGAGLIEVRPMRRPEPARTLGGVGSGLL